MLSDSIGLWACDYGNRYKYIAVGNRYKAQCSVIGNMKNDIRNIKLLLVLLVVVPLEI